jgi:hypothetical protein
VLYLTAHLALVWNYKTCLYSEDTDVSGPPLLSEHLGIGNLFTKSDCIPSSLVYGASKNILLHFSCLHLRFITDTPLALQRISELVSRKLPGDVYLAGPWEHDLIESLLLNKTIASIHRLGAHIAPYWSWVSTAGPISFEPLIDLNSDR